MSSVNGERQHDDKGTRAHKRMDRRLGNDSTACRLSTVISRVEEHLDYIAIYGGCFVFFQS